MHDFRFGCSVGGVGTRREWLDQIYACEEFGYSTLFISDHFSDKLAPLPALAMAAEHTTLNVGTFVLANDFRHPAVVAKEAATADLLSGGRVELGIGTGWVKSDYEASGIDRPDPSGQVDRLEEALEVLTGLWGYDPVEFGGDHYSVHLDGKPKPAGIKLLVGGGGERMLSLAARHADIVGISAAGIRDRESLREGVVDAGRLMDSKVGTIRRAAGDRFEALELNMLVFGLEVGERAEVSERLAETWSTTPEAILASPHFLAGTLDEIVSDLEERRNRWGISYWVVDQDRMEVFAPVVEQLSGA